MGDGHAAHGEDDDHLVQGGDACQEAGEHGRHVCTHKGGLRCKRVCGCVGACAEALSLA